MKGFLYKIYCKDDDVKEFYIGSTNNFKNRVKQHKKQGELNNDKILLYIYVNLNGGFDNWIFEVIYEEDFDSKDSLFKIEKRYIKKHKPSLNCIWNDEYYENKKMYINKLCGFDIDEETYNIFIEKRNNILSLKLDDYHVTKKNITSITLSIYQKYLLPTEIGFLKIIYNVLKKRLK